MATSLDELAEHTEVHLLPRATFETVAREGFVYLAGPRDANLHPYHVDDVAATVAWSRSEGLRRGHQRVEWWVGWRAEPADLGERLQELGLVRNDDPPTLTGMTASAEPPAAPSIEVRPVETLDDYLDAVEVDWAVWALSAEERAIRREFDISHFDEMHAIGTVHHYSAFVDGRRVGFGRAIDMPTAVALFGGAVLPEARGRRVYRALVHARWRHAVARGTPVLVVQAGPMSAPVLDGLGFRRHGDLELFVDRI